MISPVLHLTAGNLTAGPLKLIFEKNVNGRSGAAGGTLRSTMISSEKEMRIPNNRRTRDKRGRRPKKENLQDIISRLAVYSLQIEEDHINRGRSHK